MTCRISCRISEKIWSMKVVLRSHGETLSLDIETLPVLLMNYQWSRVQKWNRVRVSIVSTRTFRRTQIAISAWRQKWRGLLAEDVLVQSCPEQAILVTWSADHKILSEESASRNNHRYAVVVQHLATLWLQSYPCKTKTSQETEKSLMKFLEPTRKPKVIYTDESLEFGKSCEDLSWNHCTSTPHRTETKSDCRKSSAQSERRDICSIVAIRSGQRIVGGFHGVLLLSAKHSRSLVWWEDTIWKAVRNAF